MDFNIRRAGHVVLRVTNPFMARDFLEQVMAFQVTDQVGKAFFLMTANAVSNHHMIAVRPGKPDERLPDADRQIGMISISYEISTLDELRRLYQRIKEHGAAFGFRILRTEDRGNIYNVVCSDLDGNRLEFFTAVPESDAAGKAPFELRGAIDDVLALATEGENQFPARHSEVRRTSHLTLRCKDLARSRAFYEKALRMSLVADANGRQYFSGNPATGQLILALEQAQDTSAPLPTPKAMFGLEHVSLEVGSFPQLQLAYKHLESSGVHVHHTMDHGVTNSVYIVDPDGNLLEIYHDVARAEYRHPEHPFGSFGPIDDRLAIAATG
jgi:catechol 2,3-dioxygenase